MTTRILAGAVAGALALLIVPAGGSATHLTDRGNPGGATVPWGFNEDWGWSNGAFGAFGANFQMAVAGGIMPDSLSANRFHILWADVEHKRGRYDWRRTDPIYAAMQQHTARPVMMLYNAPRWARDPKATCASQAPCAYPPRTRYDRRWARFVRAAAARYPHVRAVEVWNEPNHKRFWAPAAEPRRYGALLRAAHHAVLAAGSDAPVLVGGLIPATGNGATLSAKTFLRKVYESAGTGAFEGIGTHPYPHRAPYVETMWNRLDELKAIRNRYGDGTTPLWITEVGVSTAAAAGVPADQQGDVLVALYRSVEEHDVESFVIHRLHDIGIEGPFWNQTGVMNEDLSPKPAYGELGAAIGTASSAGGVAGIVSVGLASSAGFAQVPTAGARSGQEEVQEKGEVERQRLQERSAGRRGGEPGPGPGG